MFQASRRSLRILATPTLLTIGSFAAAACTGCGDNSAASFPPGPPPLSESDLLELKKSARNPAELRAMVNAKRLGLDVPATKTSKARRPRSTNIKP
ncbi:hypothetical protein [Aquisphaera insulae]|uniref:hypothetical protein n=1 Tax=Aquisphaera insulae TaxID=2712864 RepID=UPI0013E9D6E6|nr:hypothetical protein [Aquisphaera insulae]